MTFLLLVDPVPASTRAPKILRHGALTIALDPRTGGWDEIRYGDEVLCRPSPGVPPLDLRQEEP